MGWIREGSCPPERCQGRCCTHIGTWYADDPLTRSFLDVLRVRGVPISRVGEKWLVQYQQRCQWLTDVGLCALHPAMRSPGADLPERPDFCSRWPEEPSQLVNDPYCGFTFRYEPEPSATGTP